MDTKYNTVQCSLQQSNTTKLESVQVTAISIFNSFTQLALTIRVYLWEHIFTYSSCGPSLLSDPYLPSLLLHFPHGESQLAPLRRQDVVAVHAEAQVLVVVWHCVGGQWCCRGMLCCCYCYHPGIKHERVQFEINQTTGINWRKYYLTHW